MEQDSCINCPVCRQDYFIPEFVFHCMTTHPAFFYMWAAYSFPYINLDMLEDEEAYEYLQQLCDEIGNVYVGVDDIDAVAPQCQKASNEFKCSICLETVEDEKVRKTKLCGHEFCCSCLEKWLGMRKTCPLCMQELQS
jgi:Ring finger domain